MRISSGRFLEPARTKVIVQSLSPLLFPYNPVNDTTVFGRLRLGSEVSSEASNRFHFGRVQESSFLGETQKETQRVHLAYVLVVRNPYAENVQLYLRQYLLQEKTYILSVLILVLVNQLLRLMYLIPCGNNRRSLW